MVDQKTAITNISVTLQDPKVTAVVADSVVCKLQEYIINYRTSKARKTLQRAPTGVLCSTKKICTIYRHS